MYSIAHNSAPVIMVGLYFTIDFHNWSPPMFICKTRRISSKRREWGTGLRGRERERDREVSKIERDRFMEYGEKRQKAHCMKTERNETEREREK